MSRKLLDRFNPTRGLPKPMRRYLGLPNRLWLIWLALSVLVPAGAVLLFRWGVLDLAPESQAMEEPAVAVAADDAAAEGTGTPVMAAVAPSAGSPSAMAEGAAAPERPLPLAEGAEISAAGAVSFTLRNQNGRLFVDASGLPPMELTGEAGGWRLLDGAGQVVYRLEAREDGQGKLYDAGGNYRFRLKCEAEEGVEACKLYDPAGNKLYRVKLKDDSFNVYGAGEERLYKGKPKHGRYELRDENTRVFATLEGVDGLKSAALLSFPVEVPVRVLLWCHGRGQAR